VLEWLDPQVGGRYIDATIGGGGHAWGILDRSSPSGLLLGIDRDPEALEFAGQHLAPFSDRIILRHESFRFLERLLKELKWGQVDGVLLDLGLSSLQLGEAIRGFSFREDGPLDMRFDPGGKMTAGELVNTLTEEELARLLFVYGEEKLSRTIARAIARARPLRSTVELAEVIEHCVIQRLGGRREHWRIHPATRTFQALRIAVNDELQALEEALPQVGNVLRPGGRLAVISFHSLEDRIVKQFLRRNSTRFDRRGDPIAAPVGEEPGFQFEPTHKPIRPGEAELRANPRSRSARLRVAQKVDTGLTSVRETLGPAATRPR
jgi:16S rRNA (cytosine1402-N4)-methyltransferase